MQTPLMVYYGPWDDAGHYYFDERGQRLPRKALVKFGEIPWGLDEVDGGLQPKGHQRSGEAVLLSKGGWTILTFWDRTVDNRLGSLSAYIAEGVFTFEQMMEMAKTRFATRWNRMKFSVTLAQKP